MIAANVDIPDILDCCLVEINFSRILEVLHFLIESDRVFICVNITHEGVLGIKIKHLLINWFPVSRLAKVKSIIDGAHMRISFQRLLLHEVVFLDLTWWVPSIAMISNILLVAWSVFLDVRRNNRVLTPANKFIHKIFSVVVFAWLVSDHAPGVKFVFYYAGSWNAIVNWKLLELILILLILTLALGLSCYRSIFIWNQFLLFIMSRPYNRRSIVVINSALLFLRLLSFWTHSAHFYT